MTVSPRARRAGALAVALVLLCITNAARAGLPGDMDGDCDVDIADALLLERSLAGFVTLTDEQTDSADLPPIGGSAKDGAVDAGDLLTLKRIVARDANPEIPLPTPTINSPTPVPQTDPPRYPNPLTVEGQGAPAGATVRLYVNGQRHPHTRTADSNGNFAFDGSAGFYQVPLMDGTNRITAIAVVGASQSCSSLPIDVVPVDPDPPVPNLDGSIVIAANTVWTPETFNGEPGLMPTGGITISGGAALFIQPGVVIQMPAGAGVLVQGGGSLQVRGTAENIVQFVPEGSGCDSSNRWDGIKILWATSPINVIEHADIDCTTKAVSVGSGSTPGALRLRLSRIRRWTATGVQFSPNATGSARDNAIISPSGTSADGISISSLSSIRIERNEVRPGRNGILLSGAASVLDGNVIAGGWGNIGISISSGEHEIYENTITGFTYGILNVNSSEIVLENNNIYGNSSRNYDLGSGGCPGSATPIDVENNWWGTTDEVAIAASHSIAGVCTYQPPIDFIPYLSAPFGQGGVAVGGENVLQGTYNGVAPTGPEWIVLGTVIVPDGQVLTVPDGTTVKFTENAKLVVQGGGFLDIKDDAPDDVVLTSLPPAGEAASPGDWQGLLIEAGGRAAIADAVIEYARTAIEVTGSGSRLDLASSVVRDFASTAVSIRNIPTDLDPETPAVTIRDNRDSGGTLGVFGLANLGTKSVRVEDVFDQVVIENNEIEGGTSGVWIENSSPELYGNLIRSHKGAGIEIRGSGSALITSGNEITGNCRGIYIAAPTDEPNPIVRENKIHNNKMCGGFATAYNMQIAAYGGPNLAIDAQNNWWGGAPSTLSTIAQEIRDRSDDAVISTLPTVDFVPFYPTSAMNEPDLVFGPSGGGDYVLGRVSGALVDPGPHEVVGSLSVAAGDSWQIGPGAVLNFTNLQQRIFVEGELVLQGTAGSEVILQPSPGVVRWGGIVVGGTGSSLDSQYATVRKAGIEIANTTGPISIANSIVEDFTTNGISFDNVRPTAPALITGSTVGPGASAGIFISDSDVVVENGTWIHGMATGVSIEGGSAAAIGTFGTAQNTIEGFWSSGVLFNSVDATPGASVRNNLVQNGQSPPVGVGIKLINSSPVEGSPVVEGNTIQQVDVGILVTGNSKPAIGDPAGATENVITSNRIGIRLEGDSSKAFSEQPDPTIRRNSLSGNTAAALEVVGFRPAIDSGDPELPAVDFVIDAKENWWGADTAGGIRALISLDPTNPRPVDFSGYFLDASMSTLNQSTELDQLSTVITRVTRSAPTFTPTIAPDDSVAITVATVGPATDITLQVYEEDDDARTPENVIYEATETGVVNSHQFVWDGRRTGGELVDNEAYVYVVQAAGGALGTYDPPRVETEPSADRIGDPNVSYNVFENDFFKLRFNVSRAPGRVSLQMRTQSSGGSLIRELFTDVPFPERDFQYLLYDGRDENHVLEGNAQESRYFFVPVLDELRPNHVIVERVRPRVQPWDYDPTIPIIEVKSDPFLVINSYDQISTIRYSVDQSATVTVQIYNRNMQPVGAPLVNAVPHEPCVPYEPCIPYQVSWSGVDVLNLGGEYELVDANYTFAITAVNPTQPELSTTYRGVIQVQQ